MWKRAGRTQSCCAIFEYDPAGWGARASRPYTGPDYSFNIFNEGLRCAATAHSSSIHTSFSSPVCAHLHSCCLIVCASLCTRLHMRRTSDLRALLSRRCRRDGGASLLVPKLWQFRFIETGALPCLLHHLVALGVAPPRRRAQRGRVRVPDQPGFRTRASFWSCPPSRPSSKLRSVPQALRPQAQWTHCASEVRAHRDRRALLNAHAPVPRLNGVDNNGTR